jgi:hypothetical protein
MSLVVTRDPPEPLSESPHVGPLNPAAHWQVNELPLTVHVPVFRQGELLHGVTTATIWQILGKYLYVIIRLSSTRISDKKKLKTKCQLKSDSII